MTGRDLLFWSLFTPLIAQALYVRKTAARFPPAEGASTAEAGEGDKTIRLLALDDSIIAGVGFHPSERSYAEFGAMAADALLEAICDKQTNPY
mgnify:CR=1 FL=1